MDVVRESGCGEKQVSRLKAKKLANPEMPDEELVLSQERSGRPLKATPKVTKMVIQMMKNKKKKSSRRTSKALKKKGIDLSPRSVRRILKDAGIKPYLHRTVPRLTASQKVKRVKFAKRRLKHNWGRTLSTDEKDFELFPQVNKKNNPFWTDDPSMVPLHEVVKHSPTIRVWGGIWAGGKLPLIFYKGNLKADDYIDLILKKAIPEAKKQFGNRKWTWQHDGASPHKAKKTNKYLEDNVTDFITSGPEGEWPGNSCDLSFIENQWATMEEEIFENPPNNLKQLKAALNNLKQLKAAIKKAWKNIPLTTLKKLPASTKRRLQEVIDTDGAAVKNV